MENNFIFTNWQRYTGDELCEVDASIHGKRRREDWSLEEVFIWITLKTTKQTAVIFRHYLDERLQEEEVKYYTDTMEMMKAIKAYIDNFDK